MRFWIRLALVGGTLNVLDALLTMRALQSHTATEANPLPAMLIAISIPLFYLAKFGVAGLFGFLGLQASASRFARAGITVGVAAYVGIATYHVLGLLA